MNEVEIAEYFRKQYPDTVKIIFTVGYHGHTLTTEKHYKNTDSFSVRNLNGEWAGVEK